MRELIQSGLNKQIESGRKSAVFLISCRISLMIR